MKFETIKVKELPKEGISILPIKLISYETYLEIAAQHGNFFEHLEGFECSNLGDLEFIKTNDFLMFENQDLPKNAIGYITVSHHAKGEHDDYCSFRPMVFNGELLCASKEKEELFKDYTGIVYEECYN